MSVSKSTRAFRTISEAGDELDLQPHVLRFWESKFPQIQPMKRSGGRRFYRAEDIEFLRGIKILLHREKHPIKDVQKLIRVKGAQSIIDLGRSKEIASTPKHIKETDLVPKRIKPGIRPVIVAPVPEPEPAPKSEPQQIPTPAVQSRDDDIVRRLVPVDAKKRDRSHGKAPEPAPQAVPPVEAEAAPVADTPPPAPTPAPAPSVDREDLQTALEKLRSLKNRWEDYK